jgi:hypothetical protein
MQSGHRFSVLSSYQSFCSLFHWPLEVDEPQKNFPYKDQKENLLCTLPEKTLFLTSKHCQEPNLNNLIFGINPRIKSIFITWNKLRVR